jgi:hypothetical protein
MVLLGSLHKTITLYLQHESSCSYIYIQFLAATGINHVIKIIVFYLVSISSRSFITGRDITGGACGWVDVVDGGKFTGGGCCTT